MSGRPGVEVARHELVLIRSEPVPVLIFLVMPLVLMAFVQNTFGLYLRLVEQRSGATGAEVAVPGQATLFAFMATATLGYYYLGDHSWGTWTRARSLGVGEGSLVGGKLAVAYAHQLVQLSLLFGFGAVAFGLRIQGSVLGFVAVALALCLFVVAYGFLACVVAKSQAQFNAFAYLGALLMAGVSGALTPFGALPGWVQAVGRCVPTYWAVRGFRSVLLDDGSLAGVGWSVLVLLVGALVVAGVAVFLFDPDERKSTYA